MNVVETPVWIDLGPRDPQLCRRLLRAARPRGARPINTDTASVLLAAKASLAARGEKGATPLRWAAEEGR